MVNGQDAVCCDAVVHGKVLPCYSSAVLRASHGPWDVQFEVSPVGILIRILTLSFS